MLDFNPRSIKGERVVALIDEAIDAAGAREARRSYLGGSAIGEPCARKLQYSFTGAKTDEGAGFTARTRRIFHRGHQSEEWVAQWLRDAGFDLKTEKGGRQFGFEDCDGRFKGHVDGVFVGGPTGFDYPALWEAKCLNARGFAQVKKHGIPKARPGYAAQVATYQAYMKLADNPAIFTVLCADTMELHVELIRFDPALAQECMDKAARVLSACDHGEILPRASDDPTSFVCRFCDFKTTCHG